MSINQGDQEMSEYREELENQEILDSNSQYTRYYRVSLERVRGMPYPEDWIMTTNYLFVCYCETIEQAWFRYEKKQFTKFYASKDFYSYKEYLCLIKNCFSFYQKSLLLLPDAVSYYNVFVVDETKRCKSDHLPAELQHLMLKENEHGGLSIFFMPFVRNVEELVDPALFPCLQETSHFLVYGNLLPCRRKLFLFPVSEKAELEILKDIPSNMDENPEFWIFPGDKNFIIEPGEDLNSIID